MMEYPVEKFKKLAEELRSMALSPEIDLVVCFPGVEDEECEEDEGKPYVIIRHVEGPEKKLVFSENYWKADVETLKGAVLFQIKALMEELQSFEGE
ncbi:hypothetical protein Thal_0558 [Thermocrinis albus DSM 14484]|uniref:Uncharacterized protein n=1 Tax=Thermocrinis albus (strain DSM 14484 / JCM 11386 / HI 11/12) TaxID=638303 RepID=D3SPV5_THEAH|nr:hypothetical protein [Thermocrinis albus]ADC89192.1 hypothetical protein Thal_0558 [Thermocrinis albus DSM 14484]